MPGLSDRPDLDQLRRQARELLRAAAAGEPHAAARLQAVSPRATLSAAQLALAREYGFPNWTALKAEVARRRLSVTPPDRWSFSGAAPLRTPAGVLEPEILIAGDGRAVLYGTMTMSGDGPPAGTVTGRRRRPEAAALLAWLDPRRRAARARRAGADAFMAGMRALLAGVTVTDDRGASYALRGGGFSGIIGAPDRSVRMGIHPVPGRELAWIELHGQDGTTTRLLRSPRAVARTGAPAPVPPSAPVPAPPGPVPAPPADGPRLHRDIGIALPAIDGVRIHLDSLISRPGSWQLYLRAQPRWRGGSPGGQREDAPVSVRADDDRGGSYLGSYVRGTSMPSEAEPAGERLAEQEELALRFLPRLDPLARALRLTFRGPAEEITADLEIGPA
jgi:hypothetical protein